MNWIRALMPLRWLFILLSGMASAAICTLIFAAQANSDKWLLPLILIFAWSSSLALTLTGYRYLHFTEQPKGLLARLKWQLSRGLVRLLEVLFVLNCAALCWLTVRMLGML
ncbi:hypothetical protein [Planctobacterium marinum]|uniref:hypothetical protein n=1 Tax=Planctobacterium marinum TaxID=1631968 RepID=UPI0030C700B2